MKPHNYLIQKRSAGFSLVEIMVALAIGMFGVLIMMQVFAVTESQKRTTTGGNDALNDGVQALYTVQGDVRTAGYGITDQRMMGCNLTLPNGILIPGVGPVTINSPLITIQDANTDTLFLFSSNSNGTTLGDSVLAAPDQVLTASVFAPGDLVVNAPNTRVNPCGLTVKQVAPNGVLQPSTVRLAAGVLNKDEALFNLGRAFRAVGYAIINGNLSTCDFSLVAPDCRQAGSWTSIANNIVSMRAQYGRDNTVTPAGTMDGIVDTYDQLQPATNFCSWARISAIRFVLVSRSVQFEAQNGQPQIVTPLGSLVWDGDPANQINVAAIPNWQSYRYKTFQTTVPIRNANWMGVGPGLGSATTPPQSVPTC